MIHKVKKKFILRPFDQTRAISEQSEQVWVSLDRFSSETIMVDFQVLNIGRLAIPQQKKSAKRVDGLWKHTCFEVFIKREGMKNKDYFEFNFSPSGDYNAYYLEDYRKIAKSFDLPLKAQIKKNKTLFSLRQQIILEPILKEMTTQEYSGNLLINLAAVLETQDGELLYYASKHFGSRPDFHHPSSFIIRI